MVRKIPEKSLVFLLCLIALSSHAVNSDGILVSYSFDDDIIHTGPDTFAVFQNSKGRVSLSNFLSTSGYQSVEIRDVANDHDFPELQGYFPLQKKGILYFHFSFLITDPEEEFNIALAGPKWFSLKKNGIGFWLSNKNGYLVHYSDSIPKKLFPLNASYWYTVDLAYYIDGGIYDLTIKEEGNDIPVVELIGSKNAANQSGSSIDKFSFIGDLKEDASNVVYYVDDVIIGTDKKVYLEQFIAPGRRKLFIDIWNEHRNSSQGKLVCLPTVGVDDFNISYRVLPEFKKQRAYDFLNAIFEDRSINREKLNTFKAPVRGYLEAIYLWHEGCKELKDNNYEQALSHFQEANFINSKLIALSEILTHAAMKSWDEVNYHLAFAYADWGDDPRYDIALGMMYFARGEDNIDALFSDNKPVYTFSETYSKEIHDFLNGVLTTEAHRNLHKVTNPELLQAINPYIMAEQQFAYLILTQDYDRAYDFAEALLEQINVHQLPASAWLERLGDTAFLSNKLQLAIQHYEESLKQKSRSYGPYAKLSDIYFLMGNLEKERLYREKIYGQLDYELTN